jgi:hypothetical protein
MNLTKTANLMLLLLLAGSTDAFATPRRARGLAVTRGGGSSSKTRDALLLNWLLANSSLSADGSRKLNIRPGRYPGRPGDDLPPTKPKPLAVEVAVDVGIVAATLSLFRRAGCIRARDCGPRTVLAARLFFGVANAVLIALYASALRYARRLPVSPVVVQDISFMEDRMRKSLVKVAVVTGLHLKFDLMPPLVVFSIIHWVAQPLWWDKETSYYRKYGLGRKDLDAFGVVRNIWIYTKEFMMPTKL